MALFDRIERSGNATPTTLGADITSGQTTLSLSASTGWPTGSVGKFWLTVGAGLANEEKILATSRSGTGLSGLSRGQDGTSASAHVAGEPVIHGWVAAEADEANQVANQTLGALVTKGDSLWASGSKAVARIPAGSDGAVVKYDSSQPAGVATGYIDERNVAASIWGQGLNGGIGVPASVKVDGVTMTFTGANQLKVMDASITAAKLAVGVVPTRDLVVGSPGVQADANSASFADWGFSGSTTIPAWATKARVTVHIAGATSVTSTATTQLQLVVGAATPGTARTIQTLGNSADESTGWSDEITLVGTGAQTVKLQAKRTAGTGVVRQLTSTVVDFAIVYYAV